MAPAAFFTSRNVFYNGERRSPRRAATNSIAIAVFAMGKGLYYFYFFVFVFYPAHFVSVTSIFNGAIRYAFARKAVQSVEKKMIPPVRIQTYPLPISRGQVWGK